MRNELIDELAKLGRLVIGSHFSDTTGGWIVRDDKGCRPCATAAPEEVRGGGNAGNAANRWWPIVLCALSVLLDGYDAQMLHDGNPTDGQGARRGGDRPSLRQHPRRSPHGEVGALFLSPLADRFRRRPLLIVSLVLFGAPTLLAMSSERGRS